jgi:hypothetical protein
MTENAHNYKEAIAQQAELQRFFLWQPVIRQNEF